MRCTGLLGLTPRLLCNSRRSPERAQKPETPPKVASPRGEEEEEEDAIEEEQEEALMVPQVKVAEDGSLIIDEERSVHFYVI